MQVGPWSGAILTAVLTMAVTVTAAQVMAQERPRAVVLKDELPEASPALGDALAEAVRQAGYSVGFVDADRLAREDALNGVALLVLPSARSTPVETISTITKYLESGGDLIACALPLWELRVAKQDGKWIVQRDYDRPMLGIKAQHILLDFEDDDVSKWTRSTNQLEPEAKWKLVDAPGGKALYVELPNLTGWDTLGRSFTHPFPDGHGMTCFRAKGGRDTEQLSVEWQEKDGTRWIATVDLREKWQDYAIPPEAFKVWQPPRGRGGPGDRLRVENAVRLSVGLAFSHTDVVRGRHEYWLADLGTAPRPAGEPPPPVEIPALEALSPVWRFYEVSGAARITTHDSASKLAGYTSDIEVSVPNEPLLALHPRPSGAGYEKNRPWRWQTLLEARSPDGDWRGAIAALLVHAQEPYHGGAWAVFTPGDPRFYAQPGVQDLIRDVAGAVHRGVFLHEGGSAFYSVFPDEHVKLGAKLLGQPSDRHRVRLTIRESTYEREFAASGKIEDIWNPDHWPDRGFIVQTELFEDDAVIDRITHELHVYRLKQNPNFIRVRDGRFWLDGQPWKAHGVNYMPSSGIGLTHQNMFEHWIGAAAYDPEIIDRDLRRIKAMGMNSVSVFIYHRSMRAHNLVDLLRRCEELGLYVNLSLRPGTPLDFRWDEMRQMIERFRLRDNDIVFAYDLAWEPSHYSRQHQQKRYGEKWRAWVEARHGSIEHAERFWQFSGPRTRGLLDVPETDQILHDGPWRKMVADYRLFLDELLADAYGRARELVLSVDPNHAVSFRMTIAGDPTVRIPDQMAYDFWGLRNAVDIWEPEAYGRIGDWEWVKHGMFTSAYAHLCNSNLPVVWGEVGVSAWDNNTMRATETKLNFQARYFRDFYRLLRESGADGIYFWWYPGGYRFNERSDFGIINPDGTDRPVTKVIREEGPRYLAASFPDPPDYWIAVDRDRDARGLNGIYEAVRDEFWNAIEQGKRPGLIWEREPGFRD